ncbi:hypothetical protein AP9108_33300 [Arthrospira sp. PCC 9108]|nr:hypothetical protein AP9108_33300 [Arthrospira sp. PCC 9108]
MAEYQLDTLPKTPSLTQPENFGISVGNTPTLIRATNTYRYRLHLQNTALGFGLVMDTSAIAYQVNVYGYRLTLRGMTS